MKTNIEKTASMTEIFDKIQCREIRDQKEFKFQGDILIQYKDYGDGFWLYKRFTCKRHTGWELVRGMKFKKDDGTYGMKYPSSEQFGPYGRFLPPRTKEESIDRMHDIWVECLHDGRKLDEVISVFNPSGLKCY